MSVVFNCIFKEFVIANTPFAVLSVVQTGQSNVQFLVFKGQMFIAFIGHLLLQDETTVCS